MFAIQIFGWENIFRGESRPIKSVKFKRYKLRCFMKKKSFCKSPLVEIFPFYKIDDLYPWEEDLQKNPHSYKSFAVTVFDHWLSREEYDDQMITFDSFGCVPKRPSELWMLYKKYEDQFCNFYSELYKFGVYMLIKDKDLVTFSSKNEYVRYYKYNIRERHKNSFFIPKLGVIITGGWNLTQHVLATQNYEKEIFENIAAKSALFVLEYDQ